MIIILNRKYKKMAQRNQKIAKTFWWKWLYNKNWGKKVLFFFFGKKRDIKTGWPAWVVKTDEERVQNMPWILADKDIYWYATEKIDGTSTTFTMKEHGRKREFYVCSRNVVFDTPEKNCFYDTNVYLEMANKYDIKNVLADIDDTPVMVFDEIDTGISGKAANKVGEKIKQISIN